MANVNFYKGEGLPSKQKPDGSFILNETSHTLWYSNGEKNFPIDKPSTTIVDYQVGIEIPETPPQPDANSYYVYEVAVDGITVADSPIADLYLQAETDALTARSLMTEWNKVMKIETANNKIYVFTESALNSDIYIALRVFKSEV